LACGWHGSWAEVIAKMGEYRTITQANKNYGRCWECGGESEAGRCVDCGSRDIDMDLETEDYREDFHADGY